MNIKKFITLLVIILLSKSILSMEIEKLLNRDATFEDLQMYLLEYLNESNNYVKQSSSIDKPQCEYCQKIFKNKANLKNHIVNFHPEKTFKCNYEGCTKICLDESSLNKHKKIHENQPFECNQCFKNFKSAYSLKEHLQNHNL